MPENNSNLGGLSDFNLSQASQASGVDDTTPDLGQLLGDAVRSETAKSQLLEQQISQLQGAKTPGLLETLLSGKGLALAAGTGIAGALGGGQAAAGFGIGAFQGAQNSLLAVEEQRKKAIAELSDRNEKVQGQLDKTRNRLATLFNTNPDAFVNPETGEPVADARVLGWYMTGVDIPVYPQTRRLLARRDAAWAARHALLADAFTKSTDPATRRQLAQTTLANMGWDNPPDEVLGALANAEGPGFDQAFASTLFRYGGPTALDAMIFADEQKLPLHDAEVLRRVRFQNEPDSSSAQNVLNQRFIGLMDEVNKWEQTPGNTAVVLQIKGEAASPEDARRQIASRALEGRTADIDFYMDKTNVPGNMDLNTLQEAWSLNASKYSLASKLRGFRNLNDETNMSEEEFRRLQANNAVQLVDETASAVAETQARQTAALRNKTATRLQEAAPGAGVQSIYRYVDQINAHALQNATRLPDGTIDRASYESLVEANTAAAVAQLRKGRGEK